MRSHRVAHKRKHDDVPAQPAILPAVAPAGIIELLQVQKNRGEELLKGEFLSIEDVRYWNLFTKEILTKAFGAQPGYIEAVLYAGEQKPYSAYEPESSLEKKRRQNFEIALERLETCMKKLNPESSDKDPTPQDEPEDEDGVEIEEGEEAENEDGRDDEEEMKVPPGRKESKPDPAKSPGRAETTGRPKVFVLPGPDEHKKSELTKFLENLGLEPVLRPEEPADESWMENLGRDSEYAFAVAVLTAEGSRLGHALPGGRPPSAQRLAFEAGFLVGSFKRGLICVLHEDGMELPFDSLKRAFLPWDAAGLWKLLVARAMKMASVEVDLNKAV